MAEPVRNHTSSNVNSQTVMRARPIAGRQVCARLALFRRLRNRLEQRRLDLWDAVGPEQPIVFLFNVSQLRVAHSVHWTGPHERLDQVAIGLEKPGAVGDLLVAPPA